MSKFNFTSFITKLAALLLATLVGAFTLYLPVWAEETELEALASDANFQCTDLKILFARGSGSELGATNYQTYEQAFLDTFRDSGLSLSFYELGSHPGGYDGFSYPSPGIGIQTWQRFTTSLGALVSAGNSFVFGKSVEEGASEAAFFIEHYARLCPSSKIIIGGYSQGGQVVSRAIQKIDPTKLFQALTFGDPKLYLPEGKPASVLSNRYSAPACNEGSSTYSHYRSFVPDCYTYQGILGGYQPYDPYLETGAYFGKLKAYCQHNDVICSAYVDLKDVAYGHATYKEQGTYRRAAEDVYMAIFPDSNRYTQPIQNVAILIDNTGSMRTRHLAHLQAVNQIAQTYLSRGDRVAIATYRDLVDGDSVNPELLCDFETCTSANIEQLLSDIEFYGGGDPPESMLASTYSLMQQLDWTSGANKSLIVFTDNKPHSPDLNGITNDDVVHLSYTIDPVNLYILTPPEFSSSYRTLAELTHGGLFNLDDSSNELLKLNQIIADRLGDGYRLFLEGREDPLVGRLSDLQAELTADGLIQLSYTASNSALVIISLDDFILGYRLLATDSDQIQLSDIDPAVEHQLCLSTVSTDGYRAAPNCITIPAITNAAVNPEVPPTATSTTAKPKAPPVATGVAGNPVAVPKAPNTGKAP